MLVPRTRVLCGQGNRLRTSSNESLQPCCDDLLSNRLKYSQLLERAAPLARAAAQKLPAPAASNC
eukprot:5171132-Pleurochrysis_carterae.AAC.1